ncbi:MAG: MFS transporter [Desulfobacteraceae bacterium]|nr:MFS transporter [Desulfobacteraceae bacterium]MCB9495018.1 MFS transporter [Desulfobacteraceae bacterium]
MTHNKNKLNISVQYFIYFSILGVFLPYFNLYCHKIGFSGFEIGAIASLKTFSTIIFPLVWGFFADKFSIRKKIFVLVNLMSSLLWGGFFFSSSFYPMMIIMFFYSLFHAPIVSFLETFTVEILGKDKNNYGKIRLWGSIGFVLSVFAAGYVSDKAGIISVVYMIFAGSLIHFLLSLKIPEKEKISQELKTFDISFLFRPQILLFLLASILMLGSHSPYYAFFSIYLSDIGLQNTFIGISWAIAVFAEIVMMHQSGLIFKKISPGKVLVFSMFAASLRWFVLFYSESSFIILLSQVLHCFSYATFHMASILYIDELTPEGRKTTGQALNNALTYGLGLMAGNLLSGYFYDSAGGKALFLGAFLTSFTGAFIMLFSINIKQGQTS